MNTTTAVRFYVDKIVADPKIAGQVRRFTYSACYLYCCRDADDRDLTRSIDLLRLKCCTFQI